MPIGLGTNVTSIQAQRRLDLTGQRLSDSFNKLSSGSRINRGGDDAAGLVIAESLKAQSRIAGQAIRNANDDVTSRKHNSEIKNLNSERKNITERRLTTDR